MRKMRKMVITRGLIFKAAIVAIAVIVALSVAALVFGGAYDDNVAIRAAETHGFTQVEVVDKSFFLVRERGCSKEDSVIFTVRAINPAGKRVEFYVCSGLLFKGATIRYK